MTVEERRPGMNQVQQIKAKYAALAEWEETALLRAVAPAARRNQMARRRREGRTARIHERLVRRGIPLRVV